MNILLRFFGCYNIADDHKKIIDGVTSSDKRHCTNVIWLFIFISFVVSLLYLSFYASKVGNPSRMFHPVDSFGNYCGMKNDRFNLTFQKQTIPFPYSGYNFTERRYSFPLYVNHPLDTLWICVKSCPQKTLLEEELAQLVLETEGDGFCTYLHIVGQNVSKRDFSNIGPCARPPVYNSTPVLDRCIPTDLRKLPSTTLNGLRTIFSTEDFLRHLCVDFYAGRFLYPVVLFISFVVALSITYAMIWDNGRIVYVFYVTTLPSGIVCSVVLLYTALYNFINSYFLESKYLGLDAAAERLINGSRVDYRLLFVLAFGIIAFTLISWFVTWTIFKPRRELVSDLFYQARKPVKCMLWLVPEAFLFCIFSLFLFSIWINVLLNLISAAEPHLRIIHNVARTEFQEPVTSTFQMRLPNWVNYAIVYHFFAFFWIKAFLSNTQKILVAEATSMWYFCDSRKSMWKKVMSRSMFILFRYHIGTVAFGSLLLLCVRVPSHFYLFFYYRIANSKRPSLVWFYRRFFCYLSGLERTLRYIHSNAFAVVGANGEDFMSACKTATNLWMDNSWNLMTTNTVARLLFTMTKCAFALIIGFFCGIYFRFHPDVEYWVFPTFLCAFLSYYIMNCFLSLHEMIIETMFLCYASEIDGFESQRQIAACGMPRKTDYGFNYYMARRIYEERRLNNSSLGFSLSVISRPSPGFGKVLAGNNSNDGFNSTNNSTQTRLVLNAMASNFNHLQELASTPMNRQYLHDLEVANAENSTTALMQAVRGVGGWKSCLLFWR